MERRAILAVLLSIIVLMGYQLWFMPSSVRQPIKESKKDDVITGVGGEGVRGEEEEFVKPLKAIPSPPEAVPEIVQREKIARIVSDKYEICLTNKGAVFCSIALKKFRKDVGGNELIDLVRFFGEQLRGGPIIVLPEHKEIEEQVNGGFYRLSADSLTLNNRQVKGTLECIYRHPDGFVVKKTYTFNNESYFIAGSIGFTYEDTPSFMDKVGVAWPFSGGDLEHKGHMGKIGPTVCADGKIKELKPSKLGAGYMVEGDTGWTAYQTPYFAIALVPRDVERVEVGVYRETQGKTNLGFFGHGWQRDFFIYAGPKIVDELKIAGKGLESLVDFGWFGWLAGPLLKILKFFYSISGNYGISIIMLTMLIQILFLPLTYKSFKSMAGMQELQPKMTVLRERYKSDPKKLNAEIMALYREHKVNPLGGCLPLIFQIPVFFALYKVLLSSIVLRHAPFVLWIKDLAVPDTVGQLPIVGIPLNILPILMGIAMFVQQKISPTTVDARQAKMMAYFMPIFMTVIFWKFPSGLVLYWLANNVITITEQFFIRRRS